ncbi:MAG: ATP-binding protein, partial [Solobacterium sp.]|nr:ATP-binding protein [Solobacterium sp.]
MELIEKINELRLYEYEREWFEFKENWFDLDELGQYISALSNSAASYGQKNGYFIWGIHDRTHEIIGTEFNPDMERKNEPIKHYLARKLSPDLGFEFQQ